MLEYLKGTLLAQGKQPRSLEELAAISDRDLQQAFSGVNVGLQELVLHPFYAANVVAYAKQMREFWTHDFVAALDKVAVPVLFVGGDCDRVASQAIAKLVAGMIPQAKFLEVKGGTHYIHYDQWDLLAQAAEQVVNSGVRLEFSPPGTELTEFDQEGMTEAKLTVIKKMRSDSDIQLTHRVMNQLRTHVSADEYLGRVKRQSQTGGYQLAALLADGQVRCVAGYRISECLCWGKFLYVDDLVSDQNDRSKNYGKEMKWYGWSLKPTQTAARKFISTPACSVMRRTGFICAKEWIFPAFILLRRFSQKY